MKFAAKTTVSPEKSRMEIERVITKYGAKNFGFATQGPQSAVMFELKDRHVRFVVTCPPNNEQATRQKWRALLLSIKAKLEVVESGISCFEDEFMAHIVLPSGETVGQLMRPQIAQSYTTGQMPRMLGFEA